MGYLRGKKPNGNTDQKVEVNLEQKNSLLM